MTLFRVTCFCCDNYFSWNQSGKKAPFHEVFNNSNKKLTSFRQFFEYICNFIVYNPFDNINKKKGKMFM